MKKKYLRNVRIHYNRSKISLYKKITGLRFKLGFTRLLSKKSLRSGRFGFLQSQFTLRTPEQNTRFPLNAELLPALPETYSFVVISDIHLKKNDKRMLEQLQYAFIKGDAFLVCVGDLTASGSKEDVQEFLKIIDTIPVPCYPIIGNHDIYRHNWPVWQELIGETVYRIDTGSTTLLMLDSANGLLGKNQLDWFEQQLTSTNKHVFVFSHCNFFVHRRIAFQQFPNFAERNRFIKICKDKVDAVFTGHSHHRYSHIAENVLYVNMEDFRDKGIFCRVHVSAQKFQCSYGTVAEITSF